MASLFSRLLLKSHTSQEKSSSASSATQFVSSFDVDALRASAAITATSESLTSEVALLEANAASLSAAQPARRRCLDGPSLVKGLTCW